MNPLRDVVHDDTQRALRSSFSSLLAVLVARISLKKLVKSIPVTFCRACRLLAMSTKQSHSTDQLVSLRDVTKRYLDGEVLALDGVSLDIDAGEFLSVMGPSGSGKSTLLNMIGALDRPTSGTVFFRGQSLDRKTNLNRLRAREIGFVFQSFYLLPNLTAEENVQVPMFEGKIALKERATEARRLLTLVGLENRSRHRPSQLSIGQRQRVAIARSLANGPSLILADEPTGALDSKSGNEIMDLLTDLNQNHKTTFVVVTHDQRVADCADKTIYLMDGRIVDHAVIESA